MSIERIEQMRHELIKVYPHSENWKRKVNNWPERQVFAVHKNFEEHGVFKDAERRKKKDGIQLKMDI